MNPQHLSDEAVAAFADGVLSGSARDRAARHLNGCAECRRAVRVQREAVLALRAAPAPALPTNLLDRLRTVPLTTPLPPPPEAIGPDGNAVLSTFAPMAAFAPPPKSRQHPRAAGHDSARRRRDGRHRGRAYLTAAVLAGVTGAIVAGVAGGSAEHDHPGQTVRPVNHVGSVGPSGAGQSRTGVQVFHAGVRP